MLEVFVALSFSGDFNYLAVATKKAVFIHDKAGSLREIVAAPPNEEIHTVSLGSKSSQFLYLAGSKGLVHKWDRKERIFIKTQLTGQTSGIQSIG